MSIQDITQEEYHFMITSMNEVGYEKGIPELWQMINSIIDKLDWKKPDKNGASTTPAKQEFQTLEAGKDHEERMLKFEDQLNAVLDLVGSNHERIKKLEDKFTIKQFSKEVQKAFDYKEEQRDQRGG